MDQPDSFKRLNKARLPLVLIAVIITAGLAVANPAFIKMKRVVETDEAVATFPHWSHQENYKCFTCHPSLFSKEKKVGMTHEDIDEGKYCGACHNGNVAFYPEEENVDCEVCHVE